MAAHNKLIIVSNRLPISAVKKDNAISFEPSAGGLATGLGSLFKGRFEGEWIGWPGISTDKTTRAQKNEIELELARQNFIPVHLTSRDVENYYLGFSNRTIWPLFHYFTQYAVYDKTLWNSYERVNRTFCDTVLEHAEPGDMVWVHDYQLLMLPQMLRERMPELTIGFFLHIPFPSFEVFRLLPWRREILEGMLGADLIGFHVYDYARHFLSSLRNRLGLEYSFGQVEVGNRIVKVDTFPMGIDYRRYAESHSLAKVKKEIARIDKKLGDRNIILSVDRLDYTKGILHLLRSFDMFLDKYPHYRGKVMLILVAVPSRTKVEHYRHLKKDIDELVGRVNGKHGTINWTPVLYMYNSLDFHVLTALYNRVNVALVTPLRDGMNLIAKEFVAARHDGTGVLILSEMAGAAAELSEALIVNPNNLERVVKAIKTAITMPKREQIKRNRMMQNRLERYNVGMWAEDFMKALVAMKEYDRELSSRKLTADTRRDIVEKYANAKKRLIMLDYDGTLRMFEKKPEDAIPDKALLRMLITLSKEPRNEVLIISGRDKETLETWFRSFHIGLVAEHGVWIREIDGEWELIEPLANYWKDEIRPILERFMDRTPGSLIEEKDYSLVWHYRRTNPELAGIRARELKEEILHFTSNLGLSVLEGNKVLEIKNAGINKGNAALKWLSRDTYDFILAAGDDRTDEDIFNALPKDAYTIKVGLPPSKARFSVDSVGEMRSLLQHLTGE